MSVFIFFTNKLQDSGYLQSIVIIIMKISVSTYIFYGSSSSLVYQVSHEDVKYVSTLKIDNNATVTCNVWERKMKKFWITYYFQGKRMIWK